MTIQQLCDETGRTREQVLAAVQEMVDAAHSMNRKAPVVVVGEELVMDPGFRACFDEAQRQGLISDQSATSGPVN